MSSTMMHKWSQYWAEKTTPLHNSDTHEHYQKYGEELKILFADTPIKSVLDIGCGNGDLFEYLGFDKIEYKGVDFSSGMLATFKARYPDTDLECEDGSVYCDDKKYDLVFSNGVLQNFDNNMVNNHFANARRMMHPNSLFVCASLPWQQRKFAYLTNELAGKTKNISFFRGCRSYAKSLVKDSMGRWFNFSDIIKLSETHGMDLKFYGSINYLYRFHVVLKLK
jgi:cyclopropane fatty-acyl-phospholipid synthase-like methyltransferase